MKSLLRLLLKTQHQKNRSKLAQTEKGMTLVELLVGSIMAFLIITPMLAFVVDMLNTDRREQVKSNTEQDIQAAVDFIAQDLSQAIYIYDNNGITAIRSQLPKVGNVNETPILVFWKRQQVKNAVSVDTNPATRVPPLQCNTTDKPCNDTYVRSLVAYYLVKQSDPNSIWCQPSGGNCPSRIERYEINEGIVKNPSGITLETRYYGDGEVKNNSQKPSPAFNLAFDFSKPRDNVTTIAGVDAVQSEVLVNYIDHTPKALSATECQTALGNPTATPPGAAAPVAVLEPALRVTDTTAATNTNSFYACVDTAKNIARVTIRGNSLRRLQDSNVVSSTENSAFFPTASVQVQGRGALGK